MKRETKNHNVYFDGIRYGSAQEAFFAIILDTMKVEYELHPFGELSFPDFLITGVPYENTGLLVEIKSVKHNDVFMGKGDLSNYNKILWEHSSYEKYYVLGLLHPKSKGLSGLSEMTDYLNHDSSTCRMFKKTVDLDDNLNIHEYPDSQFIQSLISNIAFERREPFGREVYLKILNKIKRIRPESNF